MTKLSVNINKVATLRNTRTIGIPNLSHAAEICVKAGADGITLHPRPDERHIRPHDVYEIAELLKDYPDVEYNIEGNPFHSFMEFAKQIRPAQCTLVPDAPDTFTSNQGWDLEKYAERLQPIVQQLHSYGCRVSLFMDPVPSAIDRVMDTGADRIELYTEPYAEAFAAGYHQQILESFAATARRATKLGIGSNAGHDLNLHNLPPFLSAIQEILEVSIGHAVVADALEYGLAETVRRYRKICTE